MSYYYPPQPHQPQPWQEPLPIYPEQQYATPPRRRPPPPPPARASPFSHSHIRDVTNLPTPLVNTYVMPLTLPPLPPIRPIAQAPLPPPRLVPPPIAVAIPIEHSLEELEGGVTRRNQRKTQPRAKNYQAWMEEKEQENDEQIKDGRGYEMNHEFVSGQQQPSKKKLKQPNRPSTKRSSVSQLPDDTNFRDFNVPVITETGPDFQTMAEIEREIMQIELSLAHRRQLEAERNRLGHPASTVAIQPKSLEPVSSSLPPPPPTFVTMPVLREEFRTPSPTKRSRPAGLNPLQTEDDPVPAPEPVVVDSQTLLTPDLENAAIVAPGVVVASPSKQNPTDSVPYGPLPVLALERARSISPIRPPNQTVKSNQATHATSTRPVSPRNEATTPPADMAKNPPDSNATSAASIPSSVIAVEPTTNPFMLRPKLSSAPSRPASRAPTSYVPPGYNEGNPLKCAIL